MEIVESFLGEKLSGSVVEVRVEFMDNTFEAQYREKSSWKSYKKKILTMKIRPKSELSKILLT